MKTSVPNIKENNIPSGQGIFGHIKEISSDFFSTMTKWQEKHGDLVSFRLGFKKYFLVSHPVLVDEILVKQYVNFDKMYNVKKPRGLALVLGEGLVTSKGNKWRRQRKLIQPIFYKSNIRAMDEFIIKATNDTIKRWARTKSEDVIELDKEMTRLTLEIITQSMFGTSVAKEAVHLGPYLETVLSFAQKNFTSPFRVPLYISTQKNQKFNEAMKYLNEIIRKIIHQRRSAKQNIHDDFLQLLLAAKDENGKPYMSDQQIIDEALTIFSAGHETTANALTWTFYLLSKHPPTLLKLQKEIDDLELSEGDSISATMLSKLPFTKVVIEESMRLYPPAVALIRKATKTSWVQNVKIPKNSIIFINIRNIQRHKDLWSDPDKFKPERFLSQSRENNIKFAYIPFGVGQRVCIGNHFAMMEVQLILASIIRKFELKLIEGHPVEEKLAVTLRPKYGMPMYLSVRNQNKSELVK